MIDRHDIHEQQINDTDWIHITQAKSNCQPSHKFQTDKIRRLRTLNETGNLTGMASDMMISDTDTDSA